KLELAHHHWLDALVDAAHSIPVRWVGNSFLEAAHSLFERFPNMWLLEPTFPAYQTETMRALLARDGEWAVTSARSYHVRMDRRTKAWRGAPLSARTRLPESPEPPTAKKQRRKA